MPAMQDERIGQGRSAAGNMSHMWKTAEIRRIFRWEGVKYIDIYDSKAYNMSGE